MKTYEVINSTRGSALSASQRLVLIHVAYRAGEDGECWASATTLAEDTGLDEKTVRRCLAALVEVGALTAAARPGRSAVYRCTGKAPRAPCPTGPGTTPPRTPCPDTPGTMPDPPRTPCPDTPGTMPDDPIPDSTQGSDPEHEHSRARDSGGLVSDPSALRSIVADKHAAALANLLEQAQRSVPGHAFSPADCKALRGAVERWGEPDLDLVWLHHQLGPDTQLARDSGWSTSWAAICKRLPDRIRAARAWDARGRPTERAPPGRPRSSGDWKTVGRAPAASGNDKVPWEDDLKGVT